jgi:hypothetical protein
MSVVFCISCNLIATHDIAESGVKHQNQINHGVLDTTLCDKVCQLLATGRWFSPGFLVSSTNKTDRHNITEILLKVALNTITPILNQYGW